MAEEVTTEAEETATDFICEVLKTKEHSGRTKVDNIKFLQAHPFPSWMAKLKNLKVILYLVSTVNMAHLTLNTQWRKCSQTIKSKLISREKTGSRESANHLCTISLELPVDQKLKWPVMTKVQTEVIRDIKLIYSC